MVIDLAGVVDSPKKTAIPPHASAPATPTTPSPTPVPDFTQQLLVWVNQQPPEKWESLARAFHLALITAQVAPPGFPYQGLLEQWNILSTLPKMEALTQAVMQFLASEPETKSYTAAHVSSDAAQAQNQQQGQKSRGFNQNPADFPLALYLTWSSNLDPPSTPMCSRILGSVLRPIFGQSLWSIGDDHIMAGRPYTIVGVKADQADIVTEHPTALYTDWKFRIKVASTQNYRGPSTRNMPAPRSMSAPPTMAAKTTEQTGRKNGRKNKESDSDSGSEEWEESPKQKRQKGKAKDQAQPPAFYPHVSPYPPHAYPPVTSWPATVPPAALPQPSPQQPAHLMYPPHQRQQPRAHPQHPQAQPAMPHGHPAPQHLPPPGFPQAFHHPTGPINRQPHDANPPR